MIGGLFALFVALFAFLAAQFARRVRLLPREPEPFRQLPRQAGRALEIGQPLHLALGSGGLIGHEAALTLSGARALRRLAEDTAASEVPPFITVADPIVFLYARDVLQKAYRDHLVLSSVPPDRVAWVGASPMAYAAGLTLFLGTQPVAASMMTGWLRDEAILAGEISQRYGIRSLFAMPDPSGAAVLWPLDSTTAVGEEAFAAPAEGGEAWRSSALLLTHDAIRWVLIVILIAAALGFAIRG